MSNSTTTKSGGIGFCGLLTIVFITLKLTNFITWSWWWVLAPIWIPMAIVLTIVLGILAVGAAAGIGAYFVGRRQNKRCCRKV